MSQVTFCKGKQSDLVLDANAYTSSDIISFASKLLTPTVTEVTPGTIYICYDTGKMFLQNSVARCYQLCPMANDKFLFPIGVYSASADSITSKQKLTNAPTYQFLACWGYEDETMRTLAKSEEFQFVRINSTQGEKTVTLVPDENNYGFSSVTIVAHYMEQFNMGGSHLSYTVDMGSGTSLPSSKFIMILCQII